MALTERMQNNGVVNNIVSGLPDQDTVDMNEIVVKVEVHLTFSHFPA